MSTDPQIAEEIDALRDTIARGRRWALRLADFAADEADAAVRAEALDLAVRLRAALVDAEDTLHEAEAPRAPRQRVVLSALQGPYRG